jgi:hypothetical protein
MQVFLQRTLGTKELREANIRAKPVLIEFDQIIARAQSIVAERPLRTSLQKREIEQIANFYYAHELTVDRDLPLPRCCAAASCKPSGTLTRT